MRNFYVKGTKGLINKKEKLISKGSILLQILNST